MTQNDSSNQSAPGPFPTKFVPYLDNHRIIHLFEEMTRDLLVCQPRDHLKHMKRFLMQQMQGARDSRRLLLLKSPDLDYDLMALVQELTKELGLAAITRRLVFDTYVKHDEYRAECFDPALVARVTRHLALKTPVPQAGWIMFDHPCSVREARELHACGVLETACVALVPAGARRCAGAAAGAGEGAAHARPPRTTPLSLHQQDFDGLCLLYKATLKELPVEAGSDVVGVAERVVVAMSAVGCASADEASARVHGGAATTLRVLLLGGRASGCSTQAQLLARHMRLVHVSFERALLEARAKHDQIGERLRKFSPSEQTLAAIANRALTATEVVLRGYVLTEYPTTVYNFDHLLELDYPPNRLVFLKVSVVEREARVRRAAAAQGLRGEALERAAAAARRQAELYEEELYEEFRLVAGYSALDVDGEGSIDEVQQRVQAAVMARPRFNLEPPAAAATHHD